MHLSGALLVHSVGWILDEKSDNLRSGTVSAGCMDLGKFLAYLSHSFHSCKEGLRYAL